MLIGRQNMHKNILTVVGITIVFLGLAVAPLTQGIITKESNHPISNGNTLYVGGKGEGNHTTIQSAIDNASDGDTVFVYDDSSPYYENIIVDKSINLIGEDRDTTTINGGGCGDVINVSADRVNISGFTIRNSRDEWYFAGIDINSNYSTITGNTISNNKCGIILSSNSIVMNNYISNNIGLGILFIHSNNNNITDNVITLNPAGGILIIESSNNIITRNSILKNEDGIKLEYSSNNIISENTINSNHYSGIFFDLYSNSNTITGNNISNNMCMIRCSSNNIIIGNNISKNAFGIILECYSNYNTITSNNITSNKKWGIHIIIESYNNIIYHNNFINNGGNAYDMCDNTWDDGKYGNYWDDYEERYPDAQPRLLKPWMWNTPYEIPWEKSKDRCPLINQWPKLKPRTLTRNMVTFNSLFHLFLERFPLLQRLLTLFRVI